MAIFYIRFFQHTPIKCMQIMSYRIIALFIITSHNSLMFTFSVTNNAKCSLAPKLLIYSKTCVERPLSKRQKIGFQDQLSINAGQKYCRMLPGEHSAIL